MSDNQRRVLCRLIFLLACAIPTLVSSYWICHPQTADGWAQAIKAETGVEALIDFVETPTPYETVLHKLRLTDPEHGVLLDTAQVRIRFGKYVDVEIPYEVNHIDNRGLARMLKTIHQNTVRQGVDKSWLIRFEKPLKIARADAALFAGDPSVGPNSLQAMLYKQQNTLEVKGLNLEVVPGVDGTTVGANFLLADSDQIQSLENPRSQNRINIQLQREPYGQVIWLDTLNQALPCWLASDFAGDITNGLGHDAVFVGEFQIKSLFPSNQNQVDIDGIISGLSVSAIPLAQPINKQTHIQVTLDDCQFVNGQATQWHATLDAPELRLRSPIARNTLFQDSRRFAVGNAITTAFIEGLTTRVASDPNRDRNWN